MKKKQREKRKSAGDRANTWQLKAGENELTERDSNTGVAGSLGREERH